MRTKFFSFILLGSMMALFGCTEPTYTTQDLQNQRQESESKAVPLSNIKESVEKQVNLFVKVFSNYNREDLAAAIPKLYSEDAFLNDRIHSVIGRKEIASYFDETFEKMHDSEFIIYDVVYSKKAAYLQWTMRIQLDKDQPYMEFLGMSQFYFNEDAQIFYHQDFWDFSELMGHIGGLKSIVSFVKNRA